MTPKRSWERVARYEPVQFDPERYLRGKLKDPAFRKAWEAQRDEFAALDALLAAVGCRLELRLTPAGGNAT